MKYRQLGKTDLKVSPIGIGTEHLKKLPAEEIRQIVDFAIRAGVNYFDLVWFLPMQYEANESVFRVSATAVIPEERMMTQKSLAIIINPQ